MLDIPQPSGVLGTPPLYKTLAFEEPDTKTLVLNQIDTIIEKYSPERGEKFFKKDVFVYLITVGSSFCIEEYYHLDKKLADKIHTAFNNEAAWVKKHCSDYAYSATIQPRLKKLRDRVEKMLTPKQTQAERNTEFQKTVVDLLTQILELLRNH